MEAPAWLDQQFLSSVLQAEHDEEPEVISFTVKSAVPPGNNYLSEIFRVKVEYKNKSSTKALTTSLIVKWQMVMDLDHDVPDEFDFFAKEPNMYKKLLPKICEKVKYDFAPKLYHCTVNNGLVLQDLKEEGYLMRDRFEQLDFEHCKEVFIALAKFHAASVACMKEDTTLKALGQGPPMDENDPMLKRMKAGMLYSAKRVSEITKDIEGLEDFSNLIVSRTDHLWEAFNKMFILREDRFNVMSHGDLWTTNIMFKYDEAGKIEHVKFLDFQLTRYGSPMADLVLFMWTSENCEVRGHRQQELHRMYLEVLNGTLQELGCSERYLPEQFHQDLEETADNALSLICNHLPLLLADPENGVFKLHELDPDTECGRQILEKQYSGKYYRKILPTIAKQYLDWQLCNKLQI